MTTADVVPDVGRFTYPLTSNILQWFVNREAALSCFREMLSDSQIRTLVLLMEGPNGIGKTWLLTRLHFEASSSRKACARIEFSSAQSLDELSLCQSLAQALGTSRFPRLNTTLTEACSNRVIFVMEGRADSADRGTNSVTFEGPAEIHGDFAAGDIIKGNNFYFNVDYSANRKDWVESISDAFFADLASIGATDGAVILFDSYEQASEEACLWITRQLLRKLGESQLGNIRVVIAGEQVPAFPSSWQGLVSNFHLDRFSAIQVRAYLKDKRKLIVSDELVSEIYRITHGRPDQVALFADQPDALPKQLDPEQLERIFIERISVRASDRIRETLEVAAVPEWFDHQVLSALLDQPTQVDERLDELKVFSFVQIEQAGRLRLSTRVREALLEKWSNRPSKLRQTHERAALHFEQRSHTAVSPTVRMDFASLAIGHRLVVDEQQGLVDLRSLFEQAEEEYSLATCETMLRLASKAANLSALTQHWLRYLHARLLLLRNHYEESERVLDELLGQSGLDAELLAFSKWSLGQIMAQTGDWPKAIDFYQDSMVYFRGQQDEKREGQILAALGDVYFDQAQVIGQPIQPRLFRRKGWRPTLLAVPGLLVALPFVAYAWLIRRWTFLPPLHYGMNYRNWTLVRILLTAVQNYSHAEAHFLAVPLPSLAADARRKLALVYCWLGWWRKTRDLLEQAAEGDTKTINRYHQAHVDNLLAITSLAMGDSGRAMAEIESALQTFEQLHDVRSQAESRVLLGKALLHQAEIDRGIEEFAVALNQFGELRDRIGAGQALNVLYSTADELQLSPEQHARIDSLFAVTTERTYLPTLPDKWATGLEYTVWISLGLMTFMGIGLFAVSFISNLIEPGEFFVAFFSPLTIALFIFRVLCFVWAFVAVTGVLGLLLILYSARRPMRVEDLSLTTTTNTGLRRADIRSKSPKALGWSEVSEIVSIERTFWSQPVSLLSSIYVMGGEHDFRIQATTSPYSALKADIRYHLGNLANTPSRRDLDDHILRSKLGFLLVLAPILFVAGSALVYNWLQLPMPISVVEHIGPALIFVGITFWCGTWSANTCRDEI